MPGSGISLAEVDFDSRTETQVDPIYEVRLGLDENARNDMEQDFQDIDGLLDEARWHGEGPAEQFASMAGLCLRIMIQIGFHMVE